jgi:hypothetical protein
LIIIGSLFDSLAAASFDLPSGPQGAPANVIKSQACDHGFAFLQEAVNFVRAVKKQERSPQ